MEPALISEAQTVWRLLKGILCVYKPSGMSEGAVVYSLLTKLCKELNQMDCRPPIDYVKIEGHTAKQMRVIVQPSYADHPLVVGPRYQEKDFRCRWSLPLGIKTSGVFLLGLDKGADKMFALDKAHHLRTFHVSGQLGKATDTFDTEGLVMERAKFHHVTRPRIDKNLAAIQASHQKSMFELSGLDIQSQDAYDLAVQGFIRPDDPNVPMIYGIKCVEFNPPNFTLEIHCTNETEFYLMALIHEIGMKLRTCAVCTAIRCIRHSYFTVHNALLRKHWTLEHVIANLQQSENLMQSNKDHFFSGVLKKANVSNPSDKPPMVA